MQSTALDYAHYLIPTSFQSHKTNSKIHFRNCYGESQGDREGFSGVEEQSGAFKDILLGSPFTMFFWNLLKNQEIVEANTYSMDQHGKKVSDS